MPTRSKVVALILTSARQAVAYEAFTHDVTQYAEIAIDLDDAEGAAALRAMILARETDVQAIRQLMSDLASVLAMMPIETV